MRRLIILLISITLLPAFQLQAQTPPQTTSQAKPGKPVLDADKLAEDWVQRFNALDDWYITVDGKEEGVDQVVDSMMELFAPDILAEVPPHDPDQIGPVMLRGTRNVRKWIDKLARTQVQLDHIIKRQTEKEFEGAKLIYSKPLPWGGLGISFQILVVYSQREDRRRFMEPGSVFLQFGEDGKVHRLRLFLTEKAEVVAL